MAKLNSIQKAVQRSDVLKSRRRAVLRESRGQLIMQAWPRERGPQKTELQQAWVNRFSCLARALKSPFPQMLDDATGWAKSTDSTYAGSAKPSGWYYRDVLERAAAGKLITYQEEPLIRTPTTQLYNTSFVACTNGPATTLTPTAERWDNNDFWRSTPNPTRMTFRSAGLYLIGCEIEYNSIANGTRWAILRSNGTDVLVAQRVALTTAQPIRLTALSIAYFHRNDYLEAQAQVGVNGVTAQLDSFWCVAITPENLVP